MTLHTHTFYLKMRNRTGFTLIEMMIVVAIIGILASIAIPKFANLVRKSKEGATKGNLGAIRSALSIYYSDMEGLYPAETALGAGNALQALTANGKYLTSIPPVKPADYHPDSSSEHDFGSCIWPCPTDFDGWYYNAVANDANFGAVLVDCTHTDTKGTVWTNY